MKVREECMPQLFSTAMDNAREDAMAEAGVENIKDCRDFPPAWLSQGESSNVLSTPVTSPLSLYGEDDSVFSDDDDNDSGIISALHGIYPRKKKEHQTVKMIVEGLISELPDPSIKHIDTTSKMDIPEKSSCPQEESLNPHTQLTLEKNEISLPLQISRVASVSEGTSSNIITTPTLQDDVLAEETHDKTQPSLFVEPLPPYEGSSFPTPKITLATNEVPISLQAVEETLTSNSPIEQDDSRSQSQSHTAIQKLSDNSGDRSSGNFSVSYIKTPVLSSTSSGSSSSQLLLRLRGSMIPAGRKIIKDFLASIHALDVLSAPDVFGEGVNCISEALTSLSLPVEGWISFAKGIEEKLACIHERESNMTDNALRELKAKELEEAKTAYSDAFNSYQTAIVEILARNTQICSLQSEYDRRNHIIRETFLRICHEISQNRDVRQRIKKIDDEQVHWINERDTLAHVQELSKKRTSDVEIALEKLKHDEKGLHADIEALKKELYDDIINDENISFP